jgi:hypothetical protein
MKLFFKYCWLVLKGCFDRVLVVFDVIVLGTWLAGKELPFEPVPRTLVAFTLIVLYSAYRVWDAERRRAEKLSTEIAELKQNVPEFDIQVGKITRYSVRPIIERVEKEVTDLERSLARANSGPVGHSVVDAAVLSAFRQSIALAQSMGIEPAQDKFERLSSYLTELRRYEAKLTQTYKVELSISGTRTDRNIEVTVASEPSGTLVVDNNQIKNELPTTHAPRSILDGLGTSVYLGPHFPRLQSKVYLVSYADGGNAFSKIADLNAGRERGLFDEDFYITVAKETFSLEFTVHSEKRDGKQTITHHISGETAEIEVIEK